MAWMLCEWAMEAVVVWLVVLFLKSVKGRITKMADVCMVPGCYRLAATDKRGLCLICYSQAKKKVDNGETTWEKLAYMKLCQPINNPFDTAYDRAMEDE